MSSRWHVASDGAVPYDVLPGDPQSDEREEMLQVGTGAVYTHTSVGAVPRQPSPSQQAHLIRTYFEPYAVAMARLVADRLDRCGRALILDVHS